MDNKNPAEPNVVFVGHVVIDHNRVEQTSYIRWGSPAMFMTHYFRSQYALNPTIIASYGSDYLSYSGGLNLIPRQPNIAHTLVYENTYTNGVRTDYCHGPGDVLPEITADVQQALASADILFFLPLTPAYPVQYVGSFMKYVPEDCVAVMSPQGYLRDITPSRLVKPREFTEAGDILPYFDIVIMSDEEVPDADTTAHEWKHVSPSTNIIVTQNARGADIILPEGVEHIPTEAIPMDQIVDPVGSGDIFGAALAYSIYNGSDLRTAVKAGHAASREKLLSPDIIRA